MKNYKIAVAGTGYVGLSLGVLFAQHHQVVAVDIVQAKVDMINNKKSPMHEELDGNGVLAENANVELEHFAFLFEFDGDQRHIRHVLYNCVASRPSIEGETNEDSKEVKTDTLNLQATPLANGYVKAKTGTNTTDDVYNKWYDAVYEPQAEAVDTEDTSHTEEPQG